jgi:uncharacterized protein YdbL (DUF1318 family)
MTMIRKFFAASIAMFLATSLSLAHAQDAALDQAKAQGVIGEMYTGYIGVVDGANASADVKRRIDEVNAKRLAKYTELAQSSGQTVSVVAALTAEKLIARADAGQVVKPGASDSWTKKP